MTNTSSTENSMGNLLTSGIFWNNVLMVLLIIACGYLIYNLFLAPINLNPSSGNVDPNWASSSYADFFQGIEGYTLNGATAQLTPSYPVLKNKQVGIKIASADNNTVLYIGFNEISALIDTISNSYYDPSIASLNDLSTVLAQTRLTIPTRIIQNDVIKDTSTGSYIIYFSIDSRANIIMNILSSSTPAAGSNISVNPILS
jgi:hypothetical protein